MYTAKKIIGAILILFFGLFISCGKTSNTAPAANKAPIANAGISQEITLPSSGVTLSGSGTDPDGTVVAYIWSQLSGPSATTIVNPASAVTSVSGFVAGNYVFQLLVTDNSGASGVDTMTIKVNPNPEKTLTLQPANNPDERMIVAIGGIDRSFTGTTEWVLDAWTSGGSPYFGRLAFKFDLSAIPSTATVVSANLYLYSNTPPENGNLVDANFGTSNSLLLQRISAPWTPSTTTWTNQPTTTSTDQVIIPQATSSVQDLNVDVKQLVGSMVSNGNYGFFIKLQNEIAYNSRQFVASYHATKVDKRPKLVIVYR